MPVALSPQGQQVHLQLRGCMIHKQWCGEATQDCPQPSKASKCLAHQWDTLTAFEAFCPRKGLEHDCLRPTGPRRTRTNFFEFAERHDEQVFKCLGKVIQTETLHPRNHEAATMPLTLRGLGLGNAQRTRDAAHWDLGKQFRDDQSPAPRSCQ